MILTITQEEHKQFDKDEQLIINGEEFNYITEEDSETDDDDGRIIYYIFQRPSDKKFFRVSLYLCRYGYEDYGYESSCQDLHAYEVEEKEIVKTYWVRVDT